MGKRIMLVDDVGFMRGMMRDILSKNGYQIAAEADNGLRAVELYQETKPDLTIMGIVMPEMDGIEALKAIKKEDPSAKVMMCSSMGQQAMVIEAIKNGAVDFIVKPFKVDVLLEKVRALIG